MGGALSKKDRPRWGLKNGIMAVLCWSFLFCCAHSSEAGMVYGRVSGAEGMFQPGDKFTLIDASGNRKEVTTDQDRSYSIIISEGAYRVEFTKGGQTWEAWMESFPRAIRQDIHLAPRERK